MNAPLSYAHRADEPEFEAVMAPRGGLTPYTPVAPGAFETAARLAQLRVDLQQRLGALLGGHYRLAEELADRADMVDDQQQHSDAHLASILLAELQQVERALRRLVNGEYGICEDCGEPIPQRRLERLPATTRCVACQARSEVRRVSYARAEHTS